MIKSKKRSQSRLFGSYKYIYVYNLQHISICTIGSTALNHGHAEFMILEQSQNNRVETNEINEKKTGRVGICRYM